MLLHFLALQWSMCPASFIRLTAQRLIPHTHFLSRMTMLVNSPQRLKVYQWMGDNINNINSAKPSAGSRSRKWAGEMFYGSSTAVNLHHMSCGISLHFPVPSMLSSLMAFRFGDFGVPLLILLFFGDCRYWFLLRLERHSFLPTMLTLCKMSGASVCICVMVTHPPLTISFGISRRSVWLSIENNIVLLLFLFFINLYRWQ